MTKLSFITFPVLTKQKLKLSFLAQAYQIVMLGSVFMHILLQSLIFGKIFTKFCTNIKPLDATPNLML